MANDETLSFAPNRFGGVVADADALPSDPAEFERRLAASLAAWRADGFKVVWLELPLAKSALRDCRRGRGGAKIRVAVARAC